MAWEHINKIFPQGFIPSTSGIISNQDIINQKLKTISSLRNYASRNMFYKQEEWIWGENGEFAVMAKFDAMNLFPHIDNIIPLNIYGNLMKESHLKTKESSYIYN